MAKPDLDALAQLFENKLYKSSEAFRNLVSDFQAHIVNIDVDSIKTQIEKELNHRSGRKLKLPQSILDIIDEEVPKVAESLYNTFKPEAFNKSGKRKYLASELTGSPTKFSFRLAAKSGKQGSVYKYFRRAKQKAQKPLVIALDRQIASINSGRSKDSEIARLREKNKKGKLQIVSFLDIGHMDESSVSMQRQSALNQALWDWNQAGGVSKEAMDFIRRQAAEYNIVIAKRGDPRPDVISESEVYLEAKGGNRSKAVEQQLQKFLNAIVREENWAEVKGSDSASKVIEKRVLNSFSEIGKKDKNTKNSIKKQKVNNSSKIGRSKGRKTKGTKAPSYKGAKVAVGRGVNRATQGQRGTNFSTPLLLSLLNRDLPKVVAKNMGTPALENRTGRFAGSVRVLDVVSTARGYPSIGYTYQRDPYGVYESSSGTRFSDSERDPRKLIDASIREIAAQHLQTRIFTRRL